MKNLKSQYYSHLCACGCGGKIIKKKWHGWCRIPEYIQGHHARGKKKSQEHKNKLSKANQGKKQTEETRQKIGEKSKGRIVSEEVKQKIRESKIGKNNPMYGKGGELSPTYGRKHTKEDRQKISEALIGLFKGSKHPNWNNGSSFEPYGLEFNKDLKQQVLERDNYTCQCPDCEHKTNKLDIHHIDYDKENNNLENLITLCASCHTKTNGKKKRAYFIELYQNILMGKLMECLL